MKTVLLKTLDHDILKIHLKKSDRMIEKTGFLKNKTIDIIRIFKPGEILHNTNTIIFGQTNNEGVFLYMDANNTAILDAAFEELGYTGPNKELCYRIG